MQSGGSSKTSPPGVLLGVVDALIVRSYVRAKAPGAINPRSRTRPISMLRKPDTRRTRSE